MASQAAGLLAPKEKSKQGGYDHGNGRKPGALPIHERLDDLTCKWFRIKKSAAVISGIAHPGSAAAATAIERRHDQRANERNETHQAGENFHSTAFGTPMIESAIAITTPKLVLSSSCKVN
jgi:hypothetical protein